MRSPHSGSKAFRLVVFLCLGMASLLATGCAVTYGNQVEAHFLGATPDTTRPILSDTTPSVARGILNPVAPAPIPVPDALPESLDIYFAGNPPPFPYQSLGLLEVQGAKYTSLEEVFNRLKYEAILRKADAITEVKRTSLRREAGNRINDKEEEYASVAMTAIAARYTEGRKPTTPLDSGVRKLALQLRQKGEETQSASWMFWFVVVPLFFVVLWNAESQ